jgi:hypothetical protein
MGGTGKKGGCGGGLLPCSMGSFGPMQELRLVACEPQAYPPTRSLARPPQPRIRYPPARPWRGTKVDEGTG